MARDDIPFYRLAEICNCSLEKCGNIEAVNTAIRNKESVAFYSTIKVGVSLPSHAVVQKNLTPALKEKFSAAVYVTEEVIDFEEDITCPYMILRPKNIVLGVYCPHSTDFSLLGKAIEHALFRYSISKASISRFATISGLQNELSVFSVAKHYNVAVHLIPHREIMKVEDEFEFNKNTHDRFSLRAVAAPASWISAVKPKIIAESVEYGGITVCIIKDLDIILEYYADFVEEARTRM